MKIFTINFLQHKNGYKRSALEEAVFDMEIQNELLNEGMRYFSRE